MGASDIPSDKSKEYVSSKNKFTDVIRGRGQDICQNEGKDIQFEKGQNFNNV